MDTSVKKSDTKKVRLLVLETDYPVEEVSSKHGSYAEIFQDALRDAAEKENIELELKSEFVVGEHHCKLPSEEVMKKFHAVLITGSKHDAHGDDKWILELRDWIRKIWKESPQVNFTGVCFGHQILARALGAKLGPGPEGWELSNTKVHLTDTGMGLFHTDKDHLRLHEMHQDRVETVPDHESSKGLLSPDQKVEVWGHSEKTPIQGLYIKGRLFTSQGHLEMAEELVRIQIDVHKENGQVEEDLAKDAQKRAAVDHDGEILARAILRFFADLDHDE